MANQILRRAEVDVVVTKYKQFDPRTGIPDKPVIEREVSEEVPETGEQESREVTEDTVRAALDQVIEQLAANGEPVPETLTDPDAQLLFDETLHESVTQTLRLHRLRDQMGFAPPTGDDVPAEPEFTLDPDKEITLLFQAGTDYRFLGNAKLKVKLPASITTASLTIKFTEEDGLEIDPDAGTRTRGQFAGNDVSFTYFLEGQVCFDMKLGIDLLGTRPTERFNRCFYIKAEDDQDTVFRQYREPVPL